MVAAVGGNGAGAMKEVVRRGLGRDRRATTALEFALVSPALILFMLGLTAAYSLIGCRRAMDYGVDSALRYAAVRGGSSTAGVVSAYRTAATVLWTDVGSNSAVTVTGTPSFAAGNTVTVTATYNWTFPGGVSSSNTIFNPVKFTSSGSLRVMN